MVGISASQLSSSRLVAGLQRPRQQIDQRTISADELLSLGQRGALKMGKGSPLMMRFDRVVASKARLQGAAECHRDKPDFLHATILKENHQDVPMATMRHAHGKLARVVLDAVRHRFIEASLCRPKSSMRSGRLKTLTSQIQLSKHRLGSRGTPVLKEEMRLLDVDHVALQAIERARQLRKDAHACASGFSTSRPASRSKPGPSPKGSLSRTGSLSSIGSQLIVERRAPSKGGDAETTQAELDLVRERGQIVGETMQMLQKWKSHSEVAHSLCDALLAMAEKGGTLFREEMDRRGLGVLASTVADIWKDKSEVLRCSFRLLSTVSIEILISMMEEQSDHELIVLVGLEVLNQRGKESMKNLDQTVKFGGYEVLDEYIEPRWGHSQMISLHALNLRRRLSRSDAKSLRKRKDVKLPPEDVVKLRGCWESIDTQDRGWISAEQLGLVMQMLGMKLTSTELKEKFDEVDIDGSGTMSWPEFLWLMSQYGMGSSMEHQFSEQRLKELKEVFEMFDADGNGSLDSSELVEIMRAVGLSTTETECQAMINSVDADGSGCIEWDEFLFLMSKKVVSPDNQHTLAFEFFDREGKGRIQKHDFVATMKRLSNEFTDSELVEMFCQCKFEDTDYTSISYKEFVKMMMRC